MNYCFTSLAAIVALTIFVLTSCDAKNGRDDMPTAIAYTTQADYDYATANPGVIPNDIVPAEPLNISFRDEETNSLTDEQLNEISATSFFAINAAYYLVRITNPKLPVHSDEFALLMIEYLKKW